MQPISPYFQGEFVVPSNTCPTPEVIFQSWGMDFAAEQQPLNFNRITHTALNYFQNFFFKLGLYVSPHEHSLYVGDVQRIVRLAIHDKLDNVEHGYINNQAKTPLFISIDRENLDVLTALIRDLGAGVNTPDPLYSGDAPLHFAARHNKVASMHLLLGAGAAPYQTNGVGQTPHEVALMNNKQEAFQCLQKTVPMPETILGIITVARLFAMGVEALKAISALKEIQAAQYKSIVDLLHNITLAEENRA